MESIKEQIGQMLEKVRAYRRTDDYDAAWKQLRKAWDICPLDHDDLLGRLQAMEGQLFRDEGQLQQAIGHYQTALSHFRADKNPLKEAHTLRHLAEMEEEQDHMEAAREYFEQCETIYESLTEVSKGDLANFYRAYALFLEKDGVKKSSISYWQNARDIYAEYGITEGVNECDDHLNG